MSRSTREIRLNAFAMNCTGHMAPGGLRHPKDRSDRYLDSKHWTDLAALLEQGKIDGLFLADVLGTYDVFISVSPRHSGHRSCIKRALRVAEKNLPPTCGVRLCLRPVESHCQKLLRDLRRSAAKRRRGSILIFVMFTIIVAPTDDEAAAKFEEYRSYVDYEGALALMSGWTGVDLRQYRPDQELRAMETNANQSALESFTLSDPNRHWTIREIAEFVGIGGRGPVVVNEAGRKVMSPEAYLIEREIFVVQFHGLVVIHTTDEPGGLKAAICGANLHEALVSTILSSLRPLYPTTEIPALDSSFFFTADAASKQRPFELALRIPRSGWNGLYSIGLRIALHTAVEQYRSYLAQANNI